jgi:hypothetical protein
LTRPESIKDTPTFGPEIILACKFGKVNAYSDKPRTLALEHSFFDAFGLYFSMNPIIGGDSLVRLYSCQRWKINDQWEMPAMDTVMNGAPGVERGRDFGYIDQLFASMEW